MSLNRQLWLAVIVVMTLAFGGTFIISTTAARDYLAHQLNVKNIDNVTALALTMTQMDKDPVTIELMLSAQFDAGHYRLIRLTDPEGKLMFERRNDAPVQGAPTAFVSAMRLDIAPGIAQVQDGWKQYGELTLESHDQFAYSDLWNGSVKLLSWFLIAALLVGALGSILLRVILRPLQGVVAQAEAMGERRFVTQAEPVTLEFKQLVRAMNSLSERVQIMLARGTKQLEELRQKIQIDPITGLSNRETFISTLEGALGQDDVSASGVIVILRVSGLAELNRMIGRESVDELLRRTGDQLQHAAQHRPHRWVVARLGSADFAAMAPGESDAMAVAEILLSNALLASEERGPADTEPVWAGCTTYERGESRASVLARADGALALAEQTGKSVVFADAPAEPSKLPTDIATWRTTLDQAMRFHGVRLGRFPVVTTAGETLHFESPARLYIGGQWLPAAQFIAWAGRAALMPELEARVLEAALAQIEKLHAPVSINLSADAVCSTEFVTRLSKQLHGRAATAAKLWLEVPEYSALRHLPEFRFFCQIAKTLGCRVGLKHAGHQFAGIPDLHDLGLDYLKIDSAIVRRVQEGEHHQVFLRSLCAVSHVLGMTTIATGVHDEKDVPVLGNLGVDAFTGKATGQPATP